MTAPQLRIPLANISNELKILHFNSSASTNKFPSNKPTPNPWQYYDSVPRFSQNQANVWSSCPHGTVSGVSGVNGVYGSEKSFALSKKSTLAQTASRMEHKTSTVGGYPYPSQPYYAIWNYYGFETYPQGYYWPTQSYPAPRKQPSLNILSVVPKQIDQARSVVPKSPSISCLYSESSLVELNEDNVQSAFQECMEVCNKEKSITAFEELLKEGANLKRGWLKSVFVKGDIPANRIVKQYLWSIILTFDQQVSIGLRGKLAHAWGTTLETIRNWRNRMKVATNFLPTVAKHQIDFRGRKNNPLLMYNSAIEIQKVQEMIAQLGTKGKQLEDRIDLETTLRLNEKKLIVQEKCIDVLQRRERSLEKENKKLSNSLQHWKSCYSMLEQDNESLNALVSMSSVENIAGV
ncbi:unnamed protein product [Cylindrotheca closterium]|uniref:Uncharacterized protein n=1 Tax=Cylindrotheca closterium TaxID=2856 RepID=A0AAD2CPX9_9STRA|nr:unnamed protein product [Cylindrotheca closterium]